MSDRLGDRGRNTSVLSDLFCRPVPPEGGEKGSGCKSRAIAVTVSEERGSNVPLRRRA